MIGISVRTAAESWLMKECLHTVTAMQMAAIWVFKRCTVEFCLFWGTGTLHADFFWLGLAN